MPKDSSKTILSALYEERSKLFLDGKQFFFEYLVATDMRDLEEIHRLKRMMEKNSKKMDDIESKISLLIEE
ncbi:MAG: hypothetical protein ACUVV4_00475 [Candidatus Bathyarchaeia archaeon]